MTDTTPLSTFGTMVTDELVCIALKMTTSVSDGSKRDVAFGVSFSLAFVVGGLVALIASMFLCRHLTKTAGLSSSKLAERDSEAQSNRLSTSLYKRFGKERAVVLTRRKSSVDEELGENHKDPISSYLTIRLRMTSDDDEHHAGLCNILSPADSSSSDPMLEVLKLDMLDAVALERDLMEERINATVLIMREILAAQMKRSKITKPEIEDVLRGVCFSVHSVLVNLQKDYHSKEEEMKKSTQELEITNIELMKFYCRYILLIDVAIQNATNVFQNSLSTALRLTSYEAKAVMQNLTEKLVNLENQLRTEGARWIVCSEDILGKRIHLMETLKVSEATIHSEAEGRQKVFSAVLRSLSAEQKLSEKVKNELEGHFTASLKTFHSKQYQELQQKRISWMMKLKQKHEEKWMKLANDARNRQGDLERAVDSTSSNDGLVQTYVEMRNDVRRQKNVLKQELEQEDREVMETIQKEFERTWMESLPGFDEQLKGILRSKGRMTERDSGEVWKMYQSQIQQEQKMIKLERREKLQQIQENLKVFHQSAENAFRRSVAGDEELKRTQEKVLQGILQSQCLLSTEARKIIQKNYEQMSMGVTNRLEMAKLRCQKITRWMRQTGNQWTGEITKNTDEYSLNSSSKKTRQWKREQEILQQKKTQVAGELEKTAVELEARLRMHEEEILRTQDVCLAQFLGRLVAAEARKHALDSAKQNTTISKIEDLVLNEINSRAAGKGISDEYLDVISQQHLTEVAEMIEEMRLARNRQEEIILQKVESKLHVKEREIASELNQQSRSHWKQARNIIDELFEQLAIQQIQRDSFLDLKLDAILETEKLREEVSKELGNEFQQQFTAQKKVFLSQVMALAKFTKDAIEEMIRQAVAASGDDIQAAKLIKEFLLEVQRARVNSSGAEHPPVKTKPSYSRPQPDDSPPSRLQRSTTDIGYGRLESGLLRREKTDLPSYQKKPYLDNDDNTTSSLHRSAIYQQSRSAFKKSAEI